MRGRGKRLAGGVLLLSLYLSDQQKKRKKAKEIYPDATTVSHGRGGGKNPRRFLRSLGSLVVIEKNPRRTNNSIIYQGTLGPVRAQTSKVRGGVSLSGKKGNTGRV